VNSLPNIKSAKKRVLVSQKKALINKMRKSALRTAIKKAKLAIANNDVAADEIVRNAIKLIDKAVAKNILHKNTAARKKSQLNKALNALKATQ